MNPNRMRPPVGPLGIEMVVSGLHRAGLSASVIDLSWERKAPLVAIKRAVAESIPDAIGVSVRNLDDCYYASQAFILPVTRRYIREIRKCTNAPVVVGGVGFSISPAAVLDYLGADYGIKGDGERSFPRLVKALAAGKNPRKIPGLVMQGKDGPEPALDGFDTYRAPERGSIKLGKYFHLGGQANIETSRGCNRKCVYCADPVAKGKKVRYRDPEAVAEEMEKLLELGANVFHTCDSEFNLSRGHVERVCRAIIKAGLPEKSVSWYAYCLPKPMDNDLAALMARAGCKGIDFAVDAADDRMLDALGRDFCLKDVEKAAKAMKRAGIPHMFDLLLGGPGETEKTLKKTVDRMKKIRPDRVGVSFGMRLFRGTRVAEQIIKEGPLSENPCIKGVIEKNDSMLRPVYYLSERMGKSPEAYLKKLIDDDPIFLFASRDDLDRNYNYNDNRPLCEAIRGGERGAYWDILRRSSWDRS